MFVKKHSKEQRLLGVALVALAASRVVSLVILGARSLRRLLARRNDDIDAAGLSARDRFDLYADLEFAREQERRRQAQRNLSPGEAT